MQPRHTREKLQQKNRSAARVPAQHPLLCSSTCGVPSNDNHEFLNQSSAVARPVNVQRPADQSRSLSLPFHPQRYSPTQDRCRLPILASTILREKTTRNRSISCDHIDEESYSTFPNNDPPCGNASVWTDPPPRVRARARIISTHLWESRLGGNNKPPRRSDSYL